MTLISAIHEIGLTDVLAMNLLMDAGLISDNAVIASDVAEPDAAKAVAWLKEMFG